MHAELGVDQGGYRILLGTIKMPAGTTTVDTGHHIIGSNDPTPIWSTDTSPQLYGMAAATYSTAINGWMPVPPELVAPDGLHYAYLHPDGTLRLADRVDQEVIVKNPSNLRPLAYTSAGVVLVQNGPAANGLWLLNVSTHAITALVAPSGNDDWREVRNGAAWGVDSPAGLGYIRPTRVMTAPIQAGASVSTVVTFTGGLWIYLMTTDAQGGVVVVLTGTAPGVVYVPPGGSPAPSALNGVAVNNIGLRYHSDSHGSWFLGPGGITLFTPAGGMKKVGPGSTADLIPAGDCV